VRSHDPAIAQIAVWLQQNSNFSMHLSFAGSLGGLIALAQRKADIAGCHLWDVETNSYNRPFVQRLMPGRPTALVKLADRHIGILTAPGNPLGVTSLADLARSDVRFINRQSGAGTRVWLDAQLNRLGISAEKITGYNDEVFTHSDLARIIADGQATAGIGVKAAALAHELDFVPLTIECYDLAIPRENWDLQAVQVIIALLLTEDMKTTINALGSYDTTQTGRVEWVG
jgi:putative molybdopterin biosynthesis protein